jgi:putative transposase
MMAAETRWMFAASMGSAKQLYNWRKKYSGMESSHIKELKDLKEENRRLKQMYAELMLDHQLAKHIIEKKL